VAEGDIHRVTLPTRDANRRVLFGTMLGLPKKVYNHRMTVEELEELCVMRGYLTRVEEPRLEAKSGASRKEGAEK